MHLNGDTCLKLSIPHNNGEKNILHIFKIADTLFSNMLIKFLDTMRHMKK